MSEQAYNIVDVQGRDGNVKFKFAVSWDGEQTYINQYDVVPFTYNVKATVNSVLHEESTDDEFELINYASESDTWMLCGYIEPEGTQGNAFINFGSYCIMIDSVTHEPVAYNGGGYRFNGTITADGTDHTFDGISGSTGYYTIVPDYFRLYGGADNTIEINVPFPIFDTVAHMKNWVLTGDTTGCLNNIAEYEPDLSKPYFISNQYANYDQFNGEITPSTGATYTWASERLLANSQPVLYYTGNGYEMRLKAKDVVCSKYMAAPGYIIENIPENTWTEQALEYSGPFYGTMQSYYEAKHTTLPNGTYLYGGTLSTNIPIFKDQTTAQTALDTGDYSAAENYGAISTGNYYNPPTTGTTEGDTSFGSGYPTSPFCTAYICSRNDVLNVANAFYTSDTTLLDNIKKGLELFGANPYEAICGLSWFPFDINTVATALAQNFVYFGSYKYEPDSLSIDKIVNMNASGYVDAGTVTLSAQFNSYRDLEPYTNLSVYLPYHGWEQLDIAKYYKKSVNIRYYVDIFTNTYACALVAGGQIVDVFPGNIGVTLPICGSNLSEYANSMLRAVLGTVGGTAGGAMTGAMIGGGVPGAVIGATVGGFAGLAKGTFEMAQKGSPKDHLMVKGNFSGASASYMPNYVIFRYDIHNLIVPDNLTQLYGRPSSASGKIKQFSGFLKCDTIKLNTGRMTDAEISETLTLLREGIFV